MIVYKINEIRFLDQLKTGLKTKMVNWSYEDGAFVTLEPFYDTYCFYINRQFPQPVKEIFSLSYSAISADWVIYEG